MRKRRFAAALMSAALLEPVHLRLTRAIGDHRLIMQYGRKRLRILCVFL
jgi:hypothetical protein